MSTKLLYRVLSALLVTLLLATTANYYFDLGWVGTRARLALSVVLLLTCLLLAMAVRYHSSTTNKDL